MLAGIFRSKSPVRCERERLELEGLADLRAGLWAAVVFIDCVICRMVRPAVEVPAGSKVCRACAHTAQHT